jgi:hypothetical protein
MLPIPTKIKAIAEDPTAPFLECYATDDIDVAVALQISKVFAAHQPTTTAKKEESIMSANYTGVTGLDGPALKSAKRFVTGVSANDNAQAIVKTLHRLGLVSHELETPLVQLAARGKPLGQYFQVSLYDLDMALRDVEATPGDKIGFKASIRNANLLKS